MSTNWGYACVSHDPPLISEHWLNHGDDLLAEVFFQVRAGEWPNDPRITAWDEPMPVRVHDYDWAGVVPWLQQHPHCSIVLHNEYGDTKPIGETIAGSVIHALDTRVIPPAEETPDA